MHYQQLGLGAVLARAQPCDGAGPAVELPGLRHVVYAQDEGQAACEECVSELRVEGQVMPPPPRAIVVHAAAWEDVGRIGNGASGFSQNSSPICLRLAKEVMAHMILFCVALGIQLRLNLNVGIMFLLVSLCAITTMSTGNGAGHGVVLLRTPGCS